MLSLEPLMENGVLSLLRYPECIKLAVLCLLEQQVLSKVIHCLSNWMQLEFHMRCVCNFVFSFFLIYILILQSSYS